MDYDKLLKELTVDEKASLLVGKNAWKTMNISRLDIPSVIMADGPHGLRKVADNGSIDEIAEIAVCYPSLVTVASSFDPKVSEMMGKSIGAEFQSKGVHIVLGPGINIKRHPFCGRNFEYFSEDPLVTSKMGAGFVKGVKKNNVGVCLKHYALNQQESYRMTSNSVVDPRTKYEIYYRSFAELMKLEPEMVMCSYNKVDGVYASENINLLKEVLREEFGFWSVIVSDWTAVNNRSDALIATLDLEMPGYIYGVHKLIKDFKKGKVTMALLDESVKRILVLAERFRNQRPVSVNLDEHHVVAADIAADSMVLLKNENQILPLTITEKILLVGDMAEKVRYQGGGSSNINSYIVDSIKDNLIKRGNVDYLRGYDASKDEYDQNLTQEVLNAAKNYDKIVFVGGMPDRYESEGYDRDHLSMPRNQENLINAIARVNPNVIVLLQIGSPILMPFLDNVKAVLNCYLGGEAVGIAVDRLLYGEANPSGRLAETFPASELDIPSNDYFATGNNNVFYRESIYVGYRYYVTMNRPVLFPFGYGLSYSHFEYGNILANKTMLKNTNEKIKLKVDITNKGPMDGKEVVLLFVEAKKSRTPRPKRELVDFSKVLVHNGETVTVEFDLNLRSFSYYHPKRKEFVADDGTYHLQIMKNANEILVEIPVEINTGKPYIESIWNKVESYQTKGGLKFDEADFERLTNVKLIGEHVIHKRPFDLNNNIEDIEQSLVGRLLKKNIDKQLHRELKDQPESFRLMVLNSFYQMPLRFLPKFAKGKITMNFLEGLMELINKRFIKALKVIFRKD